jgi:putative transposase
MSSPTNARLSRKVFDIDGHAHFLTFSCYNRLSLLGRDHCKRIVLGNLETLSMRHQVGVAGYCVMPNHVHVLLRPSRDGLLSTFVQQWKSKTSTLISTFLGLDDQTSQVYSRTHDASGQVHVWIPKYYSLNVFTMAMAIEKLEYMHNNPVKAGLVKNASDWPWSSAAFFLKGKPGSVRLVAIDGPIQFGFSNRAKRRDCRGD